MILPVYTYILSGVYSPQLALQIFLAILVGWLANYFVSDPTPEATRDAYLYAVGISAIFLVYGLNHAWAFLWGYEHGECWYFPLRQRIAHCIPIQ